MNLDRFLVSALFLGLIWVGGASTAMAETETACERNDDGAIIVDQTSADDFVTDTDGNDGTSCKEVPDQYRVTFYRFGLCTANPLADNTNSLASCTFLVNDNDGVVHTIEGTGNSAVLNTSTADTPFNTGSYTHMVMLVNNRLQIKHTETFARNDGGDMTGVDDSEGTTCWTTNAITAFGGMAAAAGTEPNPGDTSTLGMECGTAAEAAAGAAFTTEIFDTFADPIPDGDGFRIVFGANTDGGEARLLQSDNATTATTEDNAARILVSLATPQTVTATSQFSLAFTLTDSVSVDMAHPEGSGTIYALKNGADPFQVTLTITN